MKSTILKVFPWVFPVVVLILASSYQNCSPGGSGAFNLGATTTSASTLGLGAGPTVNSITANFTAPVSGATVSGIVTLTVSATDTAASAMPSVQFQVGGLNSGTAMTVAPYSTTVNASALTGGAHIFSAVVSDSSGASTTATVSVM